MRGTQSLFQQIIVHKDTNELALLSFGNGSYTEQEHGCEYTMQALPLDYENTMKYHKKQAAYELPKFSWDWHEMEINGVKCWGFYAYNGSKVFTRQNNSLNAPGGLSTRLIDYEISMQDKTNMACGWDEQSIGLFIYDEELKNELERLATAGELCYGIGGPSYWSSDGKGLFDRSTPTFINKKFLDVKVYSDEEFLCLYKLSTEGLRSVTISPYTPEKRHPALTVESAMEDVLHLTDAQKSRWRSWLKMYNFDSKSKEMQEELLETVRQQIELLPADEKPLEEDVKELLPESCPYSVDDIIELLPSACLHNSELLPRGIDMAIEMLDARAGKHPTA